MALGVNTVLVYIRALGGRVGVGERGILETFKLAEKLDPHGKETKI